MRPTVFVAMPCYDMMKVETCLSLLNLFNKFTMHNIPAEFRTAKSPYISHCRNLLTAGFLHSNKDFLLFVDADMQFGADSVFRMLAGNYDICCTPYRLKDATMKESYPVSFENYDKIDILPKGFVEITAGPTGLMMIKRNVFDKLKKDNPDLQIKFPEEGDMFIFPAWLKHWVSPFNTDCVRVSVSGNVHDSAPLNQIKKGNLKNEKTEDEQYLEELKTKL